MTRHIAVVDCAVVYPELAAFSALVRGFSLSASYHLPGLYGMASCEKLRPDFAILFGSRASVNDEDAWIAELASLCRSWLEQSIPILGICFGHQLAVRIFAGGKVDFVAPGQPESYGSRSIEVQQDFGRITKGSLLNLAVKHGEEIKSLPPQMSILASSPLIKHEIIRHQSLPYIGIQAHPEAVPSFFQELEDSGMAAPAAEKYLQDGRRFLATVLEDLFA
jgi:GMP synthase-like glutamine amidotransferase